MIFASVMPLAWKAEPDARIAETMKTEKAGSVEEVRAQVHECQLTEQNVFPASVSKAKSFVAMPRFRAPPRDRCYPDRPQQAAELMAGKWYVNVHTLAHPGGEIRGWMVVQQ